MSQALVPCPSGNSSLVDSANQYCWPKFLNHSDRKTCQFSRVASLSGRGGRLFILLAQSRFQVLNQAAFQLGSCLGNSALFCALVGKIGRLLFLGRVASLGREVELLVSGWTPLVVKLVLALWFASENQPEIAVLSQVNHVFVVKHNNKFKSDSQRLAPSLQVSLVFMSQWIR